MDKLHGVPFWDVGCPSFASDYVVYFGSAEDIDSFAEVCRTSESHTESLKGYEEYKNGNANATINIAYCELPVAEPVEVIGGGEQLSSDVQWEIMNVWDLPYYFKANQLHRELIWIKYREKWLRAARYTIKGLQIADDDKQFRPVTLLMGNEGIITITNVTDDSSSDCRTPFFMTEHFFTSEEECRADMASAQFSPENDLSAFCFEIIADG